MSNFSKQIYTFWEPKDHIPAYLKLCIKTWEKFLPDFKINILDYSNLDDYLGKGFYDNILYKSFSIPKQADAIRAALLYKYGGIWLDCDTVITSNKIENIINYNSEFLILGKHICFIVSKKNSYISDCWSKEIVKRIEEYKNFKPDFLKKVLNYKKYKFYTSWDYLGNSILNKHLTKDNKDFYHIFKNKEIQMLPENIYCDRVIINKVKKYRYFYFEQKYTDNILDNNGGIICLHNSWTPEKFKKMPEKEFLSQNYVLAGLFKNILKN